MTGLPRSRPATATVHAPLCLGRAFGVEIDADFELPGLQTGDGGDGARHARLRLSSDAEIDRAWASAEPCELGRIHHPGGQLALITEFDARSGYLLTAPGFGRHLIALDGSSALLVPAPIEPELWQLVVISQVLPTLAVLQGLEVIHASAVDIGGRAIAITGPSGAGKTTLATRLVADGATFVTDDVLALENHSSRVIAHPGLGLAKVHHDAFARVSALAPRAMGTVVARQAKVHLTLERSGYPLPLGAVFFLRRARTDAPPAIEPLPHVDPRMLLGSAFLPTVRTPQRLKRQLDVCASLAADVPAFRLTGPSGSDAALARLISDRVARLPGG